jgi:tRNA A-37 threonylcarbamoyl transferase component Bud32
LYRVLYSAGGQLDPPLEEGRTPLHEAVWRNHGKLTRTLLRESRFFNIDINSQDSSGRTSLHYAVVKNNVDLAATLLKYNVDAGVRDTSQMTAGDLANKLRGPCAAELIDLLSVKETGMAYVLPDPAASLTDSVESEASKLKMTTVNTTADELHEGANTAQLLETALRETGVPVIASSELACAEVISRGSSCTVIRATWRGLNVAVKQFKLEYRNGPKEVLKFVAELRVLAQVRHPSLLLLMGICIDQPQLCLITEYVPNCTLFSAIHSAKPPGLSLKDRYKIAVQLTQGLLYLHANDPPIVHRDLKPENIILDFKLNVKIADFGLARPLTRFRCEEQTTTCIGTTRFMAPELFDRTMSRKVGVEADIWALGCVLIELFTGKRPWDYITAAKANEVYLEIFHKKQIPVSDVIPRRLQDVIRRCCVYDPQQRLKCQEILSLLELSRADFDK